jgi:hypothetical protein
MGIAAIAIRDETSQALQRLMVLANGNQSEVEASLSDVIDALLAISDQWLSEGEMLVEVVAMAEKN